MPGENDITMFKTINESFWMVNGTSFEIDDVPLLDAGSVRNLEINTHLPFVYVPDADFARIIEVMQKNHPDILCSYRLNVCYWQKPCSELSLTDDEEIFKVQVSDDVSSYMLKVAMKEFVVEGNLVSE